MTTNASPTVTQYEPVNWASGGLRLLDQTLLPHTIEYRQIGSLEAAAEAIVAKHHDVPFYVVAPINTIDAGSPDGRAIPIEERDESEVTTIGRETVVPDTIRAANPAFDVTSASLITAIVTELGVLSPSYKRSIEDALELAGQGVGA